MLELRCIGIDMKYMTIFVLRTVMIGTKIIPTKGVWVCQGSYERMEGENVEVIDGVLFCPTSVRVAVGFCYRPHVYI